jgi:hypothetical protein
MGDSIDMRNFYDSDFDDDEVPFSASVTSRYPVSFFIILFEQWYCANFVEFCFNALK